MNELRGFAAEMLRASFPGIPVGWRDVGGGKDDTVPFDFTFAGGDPRLALIFGDSDDDRARSTILCRIDHIHCNSSIDDGVG